jgi:hypothetical protein
MKVLFFKTDVVKSEQIESMRNNLNHSLGFREWSFDLNDPNKIFKVEVLTTTSEEIIDLFKKLGVNSSEYKLIK